jgi:Domain of unknown function (DUF397)
VTSQETDCCWRKSSYSGTQGGECVEVGFLDTGRAGVAVRDSKNPGDGVLTFDSVTWGSFLRTIKSAPCAPLPFSTAPSPGRTFRDCSPGRRHPRYTRLGVSKNS